tara:strand:+ start:608 stop:820 length:213 start_codon:yes stop_codon:yes gene_type:complete
MARTYLRWTIDDLSKKTDIPWARLQYIEKSDQLDESLNEKLTVIKKVFEDNGIFFQEEDDEFEKSIRIKK